MQGYSVRDFVYVGVFAACWGAVEITLGSLFHALRVPFGGTLLTGAGITIALVGRLFVPRPWAVFAIAVVTALLKMLSIGGIILSPMIAIAAEGLVAELGVRAAGATRRGFLVAGIGACLYPIAHAIGSAWMVGGSGLFAAYLSILERGARVLGVPVSWGWGVLALLLGVHLAIGVVTGTAAWAVGQGLRRRGRGWEDHAGRA